MPLLPNNIVIINLKCFKENFIELTNKKIIKTRYEVVNFLNNELIKCCITDNPTYRTYNNI